MCMYMMHSLYRYSYSVAVESQACHHLRKVITASRASFVPSDSPGFPTIAEQAQNRAATIPATIIAMLSIGDRRLIVSSLPRAYSDV